MSTVQTKNSSLLSSAKMSMQENTAPNTMHNGRQRLRPFLISLIDSGTVKGLQWLDKEKTLFKIPWKHAGKQDYDPQEDSKIFMLWSANTGKYKEGIHEPEPAVWKTRLRTALNKLPDIEEVQEKTQLDIPEPYRVYKLLPKKNSGSNGNSNKSSVGHDYHTHSSTARQIPRPSVQSRGNLGPYHSTSSYPNAVDCADVPHFSFSPHFPGYYDFPYHTNHGCEDEMSMGHYAGYSPTNAGYSHSLYQHQQPMLPQRHQLAHQAHHYQGHRHHNSASSGSSIEEDLRDVNDVIMNDMRTNNGNINHAHARHYSDMAMDCPDSVESGGMSPYMNNNDPSQMNYHDMTTATTCSAMTVPTYSSAPTGGVPLRAYSARTAVDYEQHASPPSAMNAITIASNVLSGGEEGLVGCTASAAMSGLSRRSSIKEEAHCLPSEHEMSIQIYYRSSDAGYHHIHEESGCMLYFNEPYQAGIRRGMQMIQLPSIKEIPESEVKGKQREYISKILDCCEKGLSIVCRGGSIYVKRHCRSVLFWNTSEDPRQPEKKLDRDEETKIFDLDRFRQRLRQYYVDGTPLPVVPEIYFSVAQKLSEDFPLRACFISFVIRPLRACEELRTINSEARSLPHSTHSGLLRFSGPDMQGDVFTTTASSTTPMIAPASTGLAHWGDTYGMSCPMVPQPTMMEVN